MLARSRPGLVMEGTLAPTAPSIAQAVSLIDEWIGPAGPPGAGAAVWQGGEIVAEHYTGDANTNRNLSRQARSFRSLP